MDENKNPAPRDALNYRDLLELLAQIVVPAVLVAVVAVLSDLLLR